MDLQTVENDIQLAIAMGDVERLADLVEQRDALEEPTENVEAFQ